MITKVPAFQARDGKMFDNESEALAHEFMLDVRAVIQSNTLGQAPSMNVTNVSQFVLSHIEDLGALIAQYKKDTARVARRQADAKKAAKK